MRIHVMHQCLLAWLKLRRASLHSAHARAVVRKQRESRSGARISLLSSLLSCYYLMQARRPRPQVGSPRLAAVGVLAKRNCVLLRSAHLPIAAQVHHTLAQRSLLRRVLSSAVAVLLLLLHTGPRAHSASAVRAALALHHFACWASATRYVAVVAWRLARTVPVRVVVLSRCCVVAVIAVPVSITISVAVYVHVTVVVDVTRSICVADRRRRRRRGTTSACRLRIGRVRSSVAALRTHHNVCLVRVGHVNAHVRFAAGRHLR